MTVAHAPLAPEPDMQVLPHHNAIPLAHIARSFGHAAANYDSYAALQREIADGLLAMIYPKSADVVLDLGCGTGYCTTRLQQQFPAATLTGLDLALPMLHAAANHGLQDTQLLCADMQTLPLKNAAAALAVSSLALQWCAKPEAVFAELFRVLRPGGQALFSTFGPATLRELGAAWSAADAHVHVNRFTGKDLLEQAARATGFVITTRRELKVRHYPSLRAIARELKGIGAHNLNGARARGLTPPAVFARAEQAFSTGLVPGQGVPVTWEVYYLDLRKP